MPHSVPTRRSAELVDFRATVAGEDHVELGLRFFRNGASATSGGASNRNRGGGRDAPLLFEQLGEVSGLEDGQFRKLVNDLAKVSHCKSPCGGKPPICSG